MIDLSPLFGDPNSPEATPLDFRVFPRSGPARWMLETRHRRPWHLKTWPRANFRARLINSIAWTLGQFGVHLPSRSETQPVSPLSTYGQLRSEFVHLGIFLGTPGPNRKIVVYAERPGSSVFVKVPLGPISAALAQNETEALTKLAVDPELASLIPACSLVAGHLAVENVEKAGTSYADLSVQELARIDKILFQRSRFTQTVEELSTEWSNLVTIRADCTHNDETRGLIDGARKAAKSYLDSLPESAAVECYFAHGDFTRWNVLKAKDGTARIIDWELFGAKPRYFDILHYVASHDLLVKNNGAAELLRSLETLELELNGTEGWWQYVGLYFAFQAIYYADVYENQDSLHAQAFTQLRVWTQIFQLLKDKRDVSSGPKPKGDWS